MIECNHCGASNPDSASACASCNLPLIKSAAIRRTPTVDETESKKAAFRNAEPVAKSAQPARRVTVFDAAPVERSGRAEAAARPAPAARKIVGVLVTYSWADHGQIFPVYEGRNRIGRDPEQCDIVIPEDETLSSVNSHIVFRKSFTIGDDVSMGGTDVDGQPIESNFVPLRNYARIRAGSTFFTFIAVEPPEQP